MNYKIRLMNKKKINDDMKKQLKSNKKTNKDDLE